MRWWSLCVVVLVVGACMGRTPPPAPPRQASLGLTLVSSTLRNGMKVVLVRDPQASEVQVTMRYGVGAADDPIGKAGMAHLVEHLMHQQVLGTQSLFAQLESTATSFNAFTSYEATTYVARATPDKLEKLLAIAAVRVGFRCTSITEDQFLRERDVVVNEIRQRDLTSELLRAIGTGLFEPGHPYRRIIGGSPASVGSITFAEACAFADSRYATGNAALVVSGNVAAETLSTLLGKFMARIAARAFVPASPVPRMEHPDATIAVKAPIDENALMFAWTIPTDPLLAIRARAIAPAVAAVIDGAVAGRVRATFLGDEHVPVFAVFVELGEEAPDTVKAQVKDAVATLAAGLREQRQLLNELAFDVLQQSAIHGLYQGLEDGSDRDVRFATYALAGKDPAQQLGAEFQGIRQMTHDNAADLTNATFGLERAVVVALQPAESPGRKVDLKPATHDHGPRREVPDVALAHQPNPGNDPAPPAQLRTRTLPNGMRVVLLPSTSVPTVEIRVVFGAGTADEPITRRGAALLAAHGLRFNPRHLNDLLRFYGAGGQQTVSVGADHTSFIVGGVDMHLDLLLAGMRRLVRDGIYDDAADANVEVMRRARKELDADDSASDAWRVALYGAGHPYTSAGVLRHVSHALAVEDAIEFRAAHYQPDAATLVIAGHFDAALADRWIDFLFADWKGTAAVPNRYAPKSVAPAALAVERPSSFVQLLLALPARAGRRAHRLVAATMLNEIAGDIRHRLGATYGVYASLSEQARTSTYFLSGYIDAARAADAAKLLRDEIDAVLANPDAAARAFVTARTRVLVALTARSGSASALAGQIEDDIVLGRAPLADIETAREVRALTIGEMTETLAELGLVRAVVFMRGPDTEVKAAFAALDRIPTSVALDATARDTLDDPFEDAKPAPTRRRESSDDFEFEDALTGDTAVPVNRRLALTVMPTWTTATTADNDLRVHKDCCTGYGVAANVGYRLDAQHAVGLHLSVSFLSGSYTVGLNDTRYASTLIPIDIAASLHASRFGRLWGVVFGGLHLDRMTVPINDTDSVLKTYGGLGIGVQGGVDIVQWGMHRIGLSALVEGALATPSQYGGLSLGLSYQQ